ncbi:MAG: hypothetical protein ACOX3T_06145 [Bdellovibrionota bacterium]
MAPILIFWHRSAIIFHIYANFLKVSFLLGFVASDFNLESLNDLENEENLFYECL